VDTAIWCYDFLGFHTTKAKRKIHVVHADYGYRYKFNKGDELIPKVHEVYAVSRQAAISAEKLFKCKVDVLYNPLSWETPERQIDILSATRIAHEKGLERMIKLNKALDASGEKYHWVIYTPSYSDEKITSRFSKNVTFKKPIMSILEKIKKADFVVQLSDTESFGYTIVEAMTLGVNLVVTDIAVLPELGINKHNAIVVPLRKYCVNYNNIAKQIVAKRPYRPPVSDYGKILGNQTKVNYKPVFVKNITSFDIMLPDGSWLEPKHVTAIDKYDGKTKGLKIVK
jgi:glycosyltransferase involved in cell wall biosynthesis